MAEKYSHCFDYVCREFGIKEEDSLDIPTLEELTRVFDILPDANGADALAVYNPFINAAVHMSKIDKQHSRMVWELEGIGKKPRNVSIDKATEFYLSLSPEITVKYLKKK
ncbi:MAG: hypothetical protein WAV41_06065 [Microgenomates group bacterium]